MRPDHPIASLGTYGLFAALVGSAYVVGAAISGARRRKSSWVDSAVYAAYATTGFVSFSSVLMFFLLLSNDYSVKYVQRHSDASMPWFYRLTAFWGGLDGSMMWWVLLLSLFSALAIYLNRERHRELIPYVCATLFSVIGFFLLLVIFEKRPFELFLAAAPAQGKGLNPLLQNPYMATHPPSLYLGFVSATVPFAFGLAALITGHLDDTWIVSTRRWMMVSWYFLSQGLILGSLWAYEELGWGGYWGWDPVENAGFLPWLTATAFLHSIMIQERRGMLKIWNLVLVILTFLLTIMGTFMTRSGIVQSVHAFGQDNELAIIFLCFMGLIVFVSFGFLIYRLPQLRARAELDSWLSREFAFVVNNWILLSGAFFVLVATLFPTLSEAVTGQRITVGPPFFNKWMTPIGLVLLFLTGVGPAIGWRKASRDNLKQQFALPIVAMLLTAGVLALFPRARALTPFLHDRIQLPVAIVCFAFCAFVLTTIGQEFYRGAKVRQSHTRLDLLTSLIGLVARNKRRYGGYLVHVGIVLMFVGFAGGAYKQEAEGTLEPGQTLKLDRYTIRFDRLAQTRDEQKEMTTASITVLVGDKVYAKMAPAKWAYKHHADEPPTTEVDIRKTFKEDLYIILNGFEAEQKLANIKAIINPLVNWIWLGFILLAIGSLIAFMPDRAYAFAGARDFSSATTAAGTALLVCLVSWNAFAQNAAQPMAKEAPGGAVYARNDAERKLFSQIVCQCGTCGRQVLSECACGVAHQMRRKIQELLDSGKTQEQVIEYELATYPGQSALVVPLDRGFNRIAWALPYGALLLTFGGLIFVARKWTRKGKLRAATAAVDQAHTDEEKPTGYEDRLNEELDRFE